jgi:hypothetical protein
MATKQKIRIRLKAFDYNRSISPLQRSLTPPSAPARLSKACAFANPHEAF